MEVKNGRYYDTGNKLEYVKTVIDFGLRHGQMGDALREYLTERLKG
jgi:UTP--glucose-1-phosphate uridylyltransferase